MTNSCSTGAIVRGLPVDGVGGRSFRFKVTTVLRRSSRMSHTRRSRTFFCSSAECPVRGTQRSHALHSQISFDPVIGVDALATASPTRLCEPLRRASWGRTSFPGRLEAMVRRCGGRRPTPPRAAVVGRSSRRAVSVAGLAATMAGKGEFVIEFDHPSSWMWRAVGQSRLPGTSLRSVVGGATSRRASRGSAAGRC